MSPTASLESLIISLLIDTYKEKDIATCDVPEAYLYAKLLPRVNNKRVFMKLTGNFVDIMHKINLEDTNNITTENGKKILYLEILRALHSCIEFPLRWYKLYSETLSKEGLIINQYNKCVANKIINRKQCIILWYADDNKISRKDPKVVTKVINIIKRHFGELTVTRRKVHRFLGMNITIIEDKMLKIDMKEHLQEAIDMFEKIEDREINEIVTSLARSKFRDVNENCVKLSEDKREDFHSIVAKLLILAY